MFSQIGQVMLYVQDQDNAVKFWTEKAGFSIISETDTGQGMRWIEVAPSPQSETSFVIHNKELIAAMQPELHLGTPSIMLYTDNLEQLYSEFKAKNITTGEIAILPHGKVFNFADDENNYFAVMEIAKQ